MSARRLRVLYVTARFDGPYRYRVQQACEQLREDGAVANVARVDDPLVSRSLGRYGIVVLFRLPWTDAVDAIVRAARAAGVPLAFDIDDLAFDPDFARLMPFRKRYTAARWAETYGRQMAALRRTLDACDVFIGSTAELAEHGRKFGKTAYVHPNLVPEFYLRAGRVLGPLGHKRSRAPTIGYFSGSDTHDEDFAFVAGALERVVQRRPDVRLLVVGHLDIGQRHPKLASHVARLPYMHWRDFALAYAACDVSLAPLAVKNAFADSKSALKFFEAGAFMTPVVASPAREMVSAIAHRQTGFIADSEEEWTESLLVSLDPIVSERVGRAARDAVESGHSFAAYRGSLYGLLDRIAISGRGPAPRRTPLEVGDESGQYMALSRALRPIGAARDLARIVRSLRDFRPKPVGPADALEIARAVFTDVEARRAAIRAGGIVLDDSIDAFVPNDEVGRLGALPGELRSTGTDPHLRSPGMSIDPAGVAYVAMRLRVASNVSTVRAQIYFKQGDADRFSEEASVVFDVPADGLDRTVVADLRVNGAALRADRRISHIRVDPMDAPGSFRITGIALLAGPSDSGRFPSPPSEADVDLRLSVRSDSADELRERVLALADGESLSVRIDAGARVARWALEDWLLGLPVKVTSLEAHGDDAVVAELSRDASFGFPGVDIVVPIFNARDLTLRCLTSVLEHARGDYRLVAIDDASTDPSLPPLLDSLASQHERMVVLRNDENLGFVGTANRGMRQAAGRDVLLLNSDTEVFAGFLERLARVAYSDPRAGMVSPLSNNATICSVPEFCKKNDLPPGVAAAEVADIVRRGSPRLRPELVTPHGFCLYLRADLMKEVGHFDEAHFGKGFGEENDLGERAKGARYKTLLADDVYVWHEGKGSFGDEGVALEGRHAKVLARRHPGYHAAVAQFVRENPLSEIQEAVRRHLGRRSDRLAPAPLVIVHASPFGPAPGGVEHCVRDLVRALACPRVVLLYPVEGDLEVTEIFGGDMPGRNTYRYHLGYAVERFCHEHAEATTAFEEVLELFHVGCVHVHHLMFLPLAFARVLSDKRLPYIVTIHDFYAGCPSFNLLDLRKTEACCPGSCGDDVRTEACQRALFATLGNPLPPDPVAFVREHRARFQALLTGARRVTFPSQSARRILSSLLDLSSVSAEVVPHGHPLPAPSERSPADPKRLRVALVGQVAYASKGARAYLDLMARSAQHPIEWHVFGRTDLFGWEERLAELSENVRVVRHGPYDRETIVGRLCEAGIDVGVLFPAWPETFSYTLSEMLAAGLPVVARRIGALEDRLEGAPYAVLVDDVESAARAIGELSSERGLVERMRSQIPQLADTEEWALRYRTLYDDCSKSSPFTGQRAVSPAECLRLNELGAPSELGGATQVTAPAAKHVGAWWFPYAERIKPYAPESIRQIVRRKLSGDATIPVVRFRLPGEMAKVRSELRIKRRYLATTLLISQGRDPHIELELRTPLDPNSVELFRFNLWCSTPRTAYAQLFWQNEGRRHFDELHSFMVPLNGLAAAWQEYSVVLRGVARSNAWYGSGPVTLLRFDPINLPGLIGLGELAFCTYAPVDEP